MRDRQPEHWPPKGVICRLSNSYSRMGPGLTKATIPMMAFPLFWQFQPVIKMSCAPFSIMEQIQTTKFPMGTQSYSAQYDIGKFLEMLLDRGADPRVPARQARWNLVSRVLRSGNLHTLETLLQRGVYLRVPHTDGFHTVLTDAAVGGYAMVDYVLAKGYHAEPDSPEVGSALYTAVTHVDVALVDLLFEKGLVKNLCTIQEPMYPMDPQDEPIDRSILGKVTSPTGDVDAVAATMDSLLRHEIKMNSGNRSACLDSFGEGEYKPSVSGPNFQLLLDRGADPSCDGGLDQVVELLSLLATEGAKPELQLILKRPNESSISFEEIERIVARVERRCNEDDDLDLLPLLHRACCRKKDREIMPASWYA